MTDQARTKQEAKDEINNVILPMLEIVNEVMASREGQQIIANIIPIIAQYGNLVSSIIPSFVEPITSFKADAVASLQNKGFTREEAILLMSR